MGPQITCKVWLCAKKDTCRERSCPFRRFRMIGLLSDKSFGFGTVKTVPYNLFYSLLQTFKSTFNS